MIKDEQEKKVWYDNASPLNLTLSHEHEIITPELRFDVISSSSCVPPDLGLSEPV